MVAPGAYGLPRQSAFGVPVVESPLRAYVRQRQQYYSGTQTIAQGGISVTLGATPLPGSIMLGLFSAEGSGTSDPDLFAVVHTGYTWEPCAQFGILDATYPLAELWIGRPNPGQDAGTTVQITGHRGGWASWTVIEVPNIKGQIIREANPNWNSASTSITGTMGFDAPEDCVALACFAIDSGGAGLTISTAGWDGIFAGGSATGTLGFRTLRKGTRSSVTASSGRSTRNVVILPLLI